MKSADNINNLFENSKITVGPDIDKKILKKAACALPRKAAQPDTTIWSYIMYTKQIKFIAAAVVLIVVGISLLYWQSNKEIPIPPELAQMSVEELIKIHKGDTESPYDSIVVKAALEKALNTIPAREIIALAEKFRHAGSFSSEMLADGERIIPPVTQMIETADTVIYGTVSKVELDVNNLKEALLRDQYIYFEDFSQSVQEKIEIEIHTVYPPDAIDTNRKLEIHPVISINDLDRFREGHSYLLLVKQDGSRIWTLPYQLGIYPVDTETDTINDLRSGPLPLNLAWDLMTDSYQVLHEDIEPPADIVEYWIAELQSNIFVDSWLGLEYLSTLNIVPDVGDLIVNGIEKYHSVQVTDTGNKNVPYDYNYNDVKNHAAYITEALDLLIYMNDRQSIEKVISLSEENKDAHSVFNMTLFNHPARGLRYKLEEVIQQESPEPENSDSQESQSVDYRTQIREAIEKYYQDPADPTESLVYVTNLSDVFNLMYHRLKPEDKEFVPFIREHIPACWAHWTVPDLVKRLADPSFVPAIQEHLEKGVSAELLEALFACGDYLTAIDTGVAEVLAPVDAENWKDFEKELKRRAPMIRFLGKCGDITALPAIEYYLDEDVLNILYQTKNRLDGGDPACIDDLQYNAILALALLEDKPAIPKLKELYESDDIHIKILAAISLYYLEDDTGHELVEPFVNNTHRSIPEIEERWDLELYGVFQSASMYFESQRTDTLLLDRIRHGLGHEDRVYIYSHPFIDKYEPQILRSCVDLLSSKDRLTRGVAYNMLKERTGMEYTFNPDKFSGQQDDKIEVWRNYIEQYLSENPQSNYIE